MAHEANSRISELLKRRGIELPPLITTIPNEMPKQLVSRYRSGLYGTHRHPISPSREISKWSVSSSSGSMGNNVSEGASDEAEESAISNTDEVTHNRDSDSTDPELELDYNETTEERLERWRQFYSERARGWYFEKDDYGEFLDNMLFERLYNEVQYTVHETGPSRYRGQEQIRSFWDNARKQLRDEESPVLEWPPTQGQQHYCTENKLEIRVDAEGHSMPLPQRLTAKNRTADGKDPELLELRETLMETARTRPQQPGWERLSLPAPGNAR